MSRQNSIDDIHLDDGTSVDEHAPSVLSSSASVEIKPVVTAIPFSIKGTISGVLTAAGKPFARLRLSLLNPGPKPEPTADDELEGMKKTLTKALDKLRELRWVVQKATFTFLLRGKTATRETDSVYSSDVMIARAYMPNEREQDPNARYVNLWQIYPRPSQPTIHRIDRETVNVEVTNNGVLEHNKKYILSMPGPPKPLQEMNEVELEMYCKVFSATEYAKQGMKTLKGKVVNVNGDEAGSVWVQLKLDTVSAPKLVKLTIADLNGQVYVVGQQVNGHPLPKGIVNLTSRKRH